MDIYNRIQAITDIGSRRKALKALSDADKKAYTNYQSNLRKKKFMSNANNRDRVYVENREYKKIQRKKNPEKVREIVRGYVQRFRDRLKAKKQEAKDVATDVLGSIIDNTFKTVAKKQKATYMREYRTRSKTRNS